jgi:hypothetical protein
MAKDNLELVRFIDDGVSLDVSVSPREQTVWLTQEQMALLFGRTRSIITRHIRKIFTDGELEESSVCSKIEHTAADGKNYLVIFYNLDVVISVGYRVKSQKGVRFRKWATSILRDYLLRGYSISDCRSLVTFENYQQLLDQVDSIGHQVSVLDKRLLTLEEQMEKTPRERIFYEGSLFDAFEFLSSLVAKADFSVILVDPYLDDKALFFLTRKKPGVSLDVYLLSRVRIGEEALQRFVSEYGPLGLHETSAFHDRYLFLDRKEAYAIGASLNHAGRKTFGVYRMEDEQTIADLVSRLAIL